ITGEWHALPGRAPNSGGRGGGRGGPISISGTPVDGAGRIPRPQVGAAGAPAQSAANPAQAPPVPVPPGKFVRGWRIAGSSLERALGRPIRDQVYSTRDTQATTIQALELVNGETLTHWLWRGARKMLGELPPEPVSLVARQVNSTAKGAPIPFDVDISQSNKLYLIVQDSLSTAPDKAAPLWVQPELVGPNGTTPLSALKPLDVFGLRAGSPAPTIAGVADKDIPALRVKLS